MTERAQRNSGVIAGLISCVLAILGVLSLGLIFVPLAAVVAIVGTAIAVKNLNFAGIGINTLAWVLVGTGLLTSPALLGAIAVGVLTLGAPRSVSESAADRQQAVHQQRGEEQEQKKEEERALRSVSNNLSDDIRAMSQTEIPQNIEQVKSALKDMNKGVRAIENALELLRADASIVPMTCNQAQQKVLYDFEQKMGYHWEQSVSNAHQQFRDSLGQLERRLENGHGIVVKTVNDARKLETALNTMRLADSALSIKPGDELEPLKRYQSLKNSAGAQLPLWKSEAEALLAEAKEMMREGQSRTKDALRLANCR